jgi:Tfp pilus assembly protein PilX
MKYFMTKRNKGFTLLFATVVVSLMLSIGLAIANITLTQLVLSSAGRESQFAFYNADTGVECAIYYEYNVPGNEEGAPFFANHNSVIETLPNNTIDCAGREITIGSGNVTRSGATTTTTFYINPPDDDCVVGEPTFEVQVHKSEFSEYATNVFIEARGYNTCDASNPRRFERGLYVTFID